MPTTDKPRLINGRWWLDGPDGAMVWDEAADEWRPARRRPPEQQGASFARRCAPFVAASIVTLGIGAGFLAADKQWLHWYSGEPAPAASAAQIAAPEPDRVVGLLRQCEVQLVGGGLGNTTRTVVAEAGSACAGTGVLDDHLHVTVRRASGSTYDVDVPYDPSISVGSSWPR